MTLGNANELHTAQALMADGYNRNGAKLIHAEVRQHRQATVEGLTDTLELERIFGCKTGIEY